VAACPCNQVAYCSKKCQELDFVSHKFECNEYVKRSADEMESGSANPPAVAPGSSENPSATLRKLRQREKTLLKRKEKLETDLTQLRKDIEKYEKLVNYPKFYQLTEAERKFMILIWTDAKQDSIEPTFDEDGYISSDYYMVSKDNKEEIALLDIFPVIKHNDTELNTEILEADDFDGDDIILSVFEKYPGKNSLEIMNILVEKAGLLTIRNDYYYNEGDKSYEEEQYDWTEIIY